MKYKFGFGSYRLKITGIKAVTGGEIVDE